MATLNTLTGLRAAGEGTTSFSPSTVTQMPFATRVFYVKTFLSIARPKLVHDQFGMKTALPKGTGEQVLWRRWLKLATNTVPLTEGVTPTGKNLAYENVVATAKWYGDWVAITDVVDFMHPDRVLTIATSRLAIQAAESMDIITRDIINAGTGFLNSVADGASPTTGVGARSTVNGVITKKSLDTTITELEAADAEYLHGVMNASAKVATQPIGEAYVGIIHPHVSHDFVSALSGMGDDWVPREKYAAGTVAYPTEIGKYRNVRFLTSTFAKVWADTGGATTVGTTSVDVYRSTTGTAGDVYSVLIIAKEAYGVVKLAGAAATYYDKAGGNSDPIHQRSTAGWKACKTAAILNDSYLRRIEVLASW